MITVNIVDCPSNVSEADKLAAAEAVLDYLANYSIDLLWAMSEDMKALLESSDSSKAVDGDCAWGIIQNECNRIVYEELGCKDWWAANNSYNGVFPSAQIWIYGNCC